MINDDSAMINDDSAMINDDSAMINEDSDTIGIRKRKRDTTPSPEYLFILLTTYN